MNAETRFPGTKPSADRPLLTMGDVRRWREQLQEFKGKREQLLASVAVLDGDIAAVERKLELAQMLMDEPASGDIAGEVSEAIEQAVAPEAAPAPAPPVAQEPKNYGEALRTADDYMRQLALRMMRSRPDGFKSGEFINEFTTDATMPSDHRSVHRTYIYACLKRMVVEGLLDRVGDRFFSPGTSSKPAEPAVDLGPAIPGYKLVPLTKEERVRSEIRRYLRFRKGLTAHRAHIADQLTQLGVVGTEKNAISTVTNYMTRWPEFISDGEGNYTLDRSKIKDGDV